MAGDRIALTPPMGWKSWNCWRGNVDQEEILRSARAMVASGLSDHGWTYVNMDDGWQGVRGGEFNAIQPDPKRFPNIKTMCEEIHAAGLKVGFYSTPLVTSYDGHCGGSFEDPQGVWDSSLRNGPMNLRKLPFDLGKYHFFDQDARQLAAWGIDYLKFDWARIQLPETLEMAQALKASGRDVILSLSNNATNSLFATVPQIFRVANSWRISGDIDDSWSSIAGHGFGDERWAPCAGPGHWNDPDMFEVGANGGGTKKRLTPDERYTHVSLWCHLWAPLLLGCDLDHIDASTLNLLTNDEVLAVDQDALGRQATTVAVRGQTQVMVKRLADGTIAVGLFNGGPIQASVTADWSDLRISGPREVRDLWRQRNLGTFEGRFQADVPRHGVVLVKVGLATATGD